MSAQYCKVKRKASHSTDLLSNCDIGVELPSRTIQLGLNFASKLPEFFAGSEMGESAIRISSEYLKIYIRIQTDIYAEATIFRELSKKHLELCEKSNKKSWRSKDAVCMKHLDSYFGLMLVGEISPEDVEAYKNQRIVAYKNKQKDKFKPATINHEPSCLRLVINKAIFEWRNPEDKRLPLFSGANPAARFKHLKEVARDRFLTKGDLVRLLDASSPKLRDFILIAVCTGMRKGELQGIKPEHINLERNYILLQETKNGEKRYVPINETGLNAILS